MTPDPAIIDLIIERATYGLSSADEERLDRLIMSSENPIEVRREIERFELSLAAVELSQTNIPPETVLKPELQQRISEQSFDAIEQNRLTLPTVATRLTAAAPVTPTTPGLNTPSRSPARRRLPIREIVPWSIAAASLLTLAFFIRQSPEPKQTLTEIPIAQSTGSPADLADDLLPTDEQMKTFLGSTPEDLLTLSWTPVDNKNVTGEVFWSDQQQTGYMTFTGMEVNDPGRQQYQVWIYDSVTQGQPVNGGVFDVSKTGRYVVPIAPVNRVKQAVQFAITTEQPGGVDVSLRKHVPTVASKPF